MESLNINYSEESILIVENDSELRETLVRLLSTLGFAEVCAVIARFQREHNT